MTLKRWHIAAVGLLCGVLVAAGGFRAANAAPVTLVVDRGLPVDNLNNAAGADRSNVQWDFAGYGYFAGDDFVIPGAGQYKIDTIKFWIGANAGASDVGNNNADMGDDPLYDLGQTYDQIAFYFGEAGNPSVPLAALGTFTGIGNETNNSAISITRVLYNDATQFDYGTPSTFNQIFEVEIQLGAIVEAGVSYQFGAECRAAGDTDNDTPTNYGDDTFSLCFMHASNKDLSGSPQQSADNLYSAFYVDDLNGPAMFDSQLNSDGNGWDKSSDINVQVYASQVNEPAFAATFGIGVIGLVAARRWERKKRSA